MPIDLSTLQTQIQVINLVNAMLRTATQTAMQLTAQANIATNITYPVIVSVLGDDAASTIQQTHADAVSAVLSTFDNLGQTEPVIVPFPTALTPIPLPPIPGPITPITPASLKVSRK